MKRSEFETLALEQLDALHRMAHHLARQPELAADLVQETYLRAFKAAARFEPRSAGIRPWLFRILHNVFYTTLDKRRREVRVHDELLHQPIIGSDPAGGRDLASLDWDQLAAPLKHAIDELDDRYREVLLLWSVEGMKYREIAQVLDIPIGTVMSRLHRAREILSTQLGSPAQALTAFTAAANASMASL